MLPFMDIVGNSYRYNQEAVLPGVGFRGVNEGYQESTGVVNQLSEGLVIAGGDVDVDPVLSSKLAVMSTTSAQSKRK
ncbi:hypothetical protein P7H06_25485 [Paenibacillus larvae]|nr:hypothetical protein [Paenibacillus larvae]MDT2262171.1 hypothetical protein [Paenibacillus larvae]